MASQKSENYAVFRECVSSVIIARSNQHKPKKTPKRRSYRSSKTAKRKDNVDSEDNKSSATSSGEEENPEELADFIDFIATEIFTILPEPLQTLSYSAMQHSPALSETYSVPLSHNTLESLSNPLPSSISDTLQTYGYSPDLDPPSLLSRVLNEYIPGVTKPPPVWATTRASACEICERDWIPLSYHHLIPRGVHEKVIKKGWHDEWMLNSVAWLCRACHSFVHRMAGNEELAREWFTIERILEREDVRDWAKWVGRVRWKAR
ncbi:HNH endonuclease [Aspergillus undulatus]|uniref:HNH endonuclease n=1 Tax=Aspergillus undulatus TaxID=1810928 RepID=UPI003CCD724C